MKKRIKIVSLIVVIIIGIISTTIFFNNKYTKKHKSKKERLKELINISELDHDFIDDYFNDYKEMAARDNQENILIVISENGIKNTYGAVQVVNAPNHQYFLQYETEKDRKEAYKKLKEDNYLSVEENAVYEIEENNDNNIDSSSEYMSWGIDAMGLDYAIGESNKRDLPDVVVAVMDTGLNVDLFNQTFPGKLAGTYNAMNASDNEGDINDVSTERGHGTHVAGTIAEGTPNNTKILAIKVGVYNFSTVVLINALNYISINNNVDVVNMSLGSYRNSNAYYLPIEALKEQNVLVVASAGNDNVPYEHYPASLDNTISVSSINNQMEKSSFSNYGVDVTFAAPGDEITSIYGAVVKGAYREKNTVSGTSQAAPHVSAAAAIVKSYNKEINLEDSIEVLKSTVDDLGEYGWDKYFGYGMINFRNREFCDGANDNCDKYKVFKSDEVDIDEVVKIEFTDTYIPTYNYGNITNLMDANINIYYTENNYVTKKLGELDDVEITNYDAFSYIEQDVSIKYKEKTTTFTVDNRNNNISGWNYEIIDDNTVSLTQFLYTDNSPTKVYVPNVIDNYNVASLGESLFENNTFIKKVYLPNGITKIGNSAFKNSNIELIDIKSDSINVGDYAFYEAKRLNTINGSLNNLGDYAFYKCNSLKQVTLVNNIHNIGDHAFEDATNLSEINIPDGLTYLGDYAFSNSNITSITIPGSISEVATGLCYKCNNLNELTISNGVETIKPAAFQETNIHSLNIPSSVSKIAETSFSDIMALSSITANNNNNYYDVIDNTLIDKLDNKLIIGNIEVRPDRSVVAICCSCYTRWC